MATRKQKLKAIRALEKNGYVKTADLIRAARDPDHACHDDFTWDIEKAAAERWHDQARALIRSFHFEVETEEIVFKVPHYVSTWVEDEAVFRDLPKIRSKADVAELFYAEVSQLVGVTSRVLGIAEAKRAHVGNKAVVTLRRCRDSLAGLIGE